MALEGWMAWVIATRVGISLRRVSDIWTYFDLLAGVVLTIVWLFKVLLGRDSRGRWGRNSSPPSVIATRPGGGQRGGGRTGASATVAEAGLVGAIAGVRLRDTLPGTG